MKARPAPKRVRTPNCTHITMERVHYDEDLPCPVCGRVPPMRFLYECRQDDDIAFSHCAVVDDEDPEEQAKSPLRQELEHIGLSKSVILTAEQGGYTDQQLEKLKTLKQELKQAIADAVQVQQIGIADAKLSNWQPGPSNNDGALNSSPTKNLTVPTCSFRACHTCRPYFRDRIYLSLDAIFSNHVQPMTKNEAALLPTKSAKIMRTIGLAKPPYFSADVSPSTLLTTDSMLDSESAPSRSSVVTFKTTQSDVDDLDESRRHRRRFYKMGHRSSGSISRDLSHLPLFTRRGLKSALQGFFRPSRESSSSGSNITLPLPRTNVARSADDVPAVGEFDMGALRRVRRQKERNDLRNGMYTGGEENVTMGRKRGHSQVRSNDDDSSSSSSESSDYTVYSGTSEGSEVEVDGGVALTEEAVETHTPDILSDPVVAQQAGLGDEEVDLDSIMTQA